ncbi:MAG: LysM peptidoglycan-binding domain-containing protein [Bacteroidota bacterium]
MRSFYKIVICFLCSWISVNVHAQSIINTADTAYIHSKIRYTDYYDFVQYDKNFFEWYDVSAIAPFFKKLANVDKEKITVLHIGDSHVQSDFNTGETREILQGVFGHGGRGMVFPYRSGGTHPAYDYVTGSFGEWINSRNVEIKPKLNLGISGISVFTKDSTAGFSIHFRSSYNYIKSDFRKFRIFCHKGPESFNLKVYAGGSDTPIFLDCSKNDGIPWVEFIAPKSSDSIKVFVNETDTIQKYFECYGLMIESVENKGILYNSVGINGAGFRSILMQNLMPDHLKVLKPDMVVLDLGLNDYFRGTFNENQLFSYVTKIIGMVRDACPNAVIVLPNSQNIIFRRANCINCYKFSLLSRVVAKKFNLVFYDFFNVSGGDRSMMKWYAKGLSQRDRCHLSVKGYKVKGELYANALMNSYLLYLKNHPDSLLVYRDKLDTAGYGKVFLHKNTYYDRNDPAFKTDKIDTYKNETIVSNESPNSKGNAIYYKVQAGDNLGKIASKFGVSVQEIKNWNHMKSDFIVVGESLLIYKRRGHGGVSTGINKTNQKTNTNTNQNQTISSKKTTHVVKSGETLWSIAKKYGTTVEKIKKQNGMHSENLQPGTKLIIPQ